MRRIYSSGSVHWIPYCEPGRDEPVWWPPARHNSQVSKSIGLNKKISILTSRELNKFRESLTFSRSAPKYLSFYIKKVVFQTALIKKKIKFSSDRRNSEGIGCKVITKGLLTHVAKYINTSMYKQSFPTSESLFLNMRNKTLLVQFTKQLAKIERLKYLLNFDCTV